MRKNIGIVMAVALSAIASVGLTGCLDLKGDGEMVLNDYKDCFSYVLDESSNTGFIDSGSSYQVIGDNETGTFTIEANNVRFYDGAPALSAKVT